jgi:tetratricopeptide (TPR) repeat protein
MPETMDTRLSRLRERAERALASGRRGGDVLTVLYTITREAPDGSAHALFAHRHLAELQLSGSPWRAALHLRRLVQAGAADDSAHALMGLSQALLGNYRMAVAAYRRAIKLAPRNPWYHHNLGHLLDVGLSDSVAALEHLRMAHRIQPEEDEIAASLAHCLARLGQLKEAQLMAQRAVRRSPRNREHVALLEWIKSGAPSNVVPSARGTEARVNRRTSRAPGEGDALAATSSNAASDKPDKPNADKPSQDVTAAAGSKAHSPRPVLKAAAPIGPQSPVQTSLDRADAQSGHTGPSGEASVRAAYAEADHDVEEEAELSPALGRVLSMLEAYGEAPTDAADAAQYMKIARRVWVDFCAQRQPRVQKPAVYAAAVEYTLSKLASRPVTQAKLARRYGVTARAIAARYEEIREALALEPGDPRYVGSAR